MEKDVKKIELDLLMFDGTIDKLCAINLKSNPDVLVYFGNMIAHKELQKMDINQSGVYIFRDNFDIKIRKSNDINKKENYTRFYFLTNKKKIFNDLELNYLIKTLDDIFYNRLSGEYLDIYDISNGKLNIMIKDFLLLLKLVDVYGFRGLNPHSLECKTTLILERKAEVLKYLKLKKCKFINNNFVTYASLNRSVDMYWANPRVEVLENDWTLILNNYITRTIYILFIPKMFLSASYNSAMGTLFIRNDASKKDVLDIKINSKDFIELRSGQDFSKFIVNRYKY